jgi:ribonucleoside-diphosphate reductase alpha chain
MIKIVNNTVPSALFKLGYTDDQVQAIVSYIDATGTIEGAPSIKHEHLPVFDCSIKPAKGTRSIHYLGHIKMMSATQPFLSGAISKTVNLPNSASVEEIAEAYTESWRLGLKAVAIYRDGSKGSQPLNVSGDDKKSEKAVAKPALTDEELEKLVRERMTAALTQDLDGPPRAVRHRLGDERASVTHKFSIAGHEGYITVGLYKNGMPGEIFIKMAKEGSTVSGLMDCFATAISLSLQHGVPLKTLCEKFAHTRFEPSGWTQNSELGYAKSIMDYIFRWLQLRFLTGQQQSLFGGLLSKSDLYVGAEGAAEPSAISSQPSALLPDRGMGYTSAPQGSIASEATHDSQLKTHDYGTPDRGVTSGHAANALAGMVDLGDAPSCHTCGAIMTRNGSCYRCMECGSTSGCS